jgi:hypothetical protein
MGWGDAGLATTRGFLFLPSPGIIAFYRRLVSSLLLRSSLPPFTSPFSRFPSSGYTYISNLTDPTHPVLYSPDPSQKLLFCHHPFLPLAGPSTPARISCHCPTLVPSPQFHDYSSLPPIFFRLSQSRLPSNTTLPCASTADLRRLQLPFTTVVTDRLHPWAATPGLALTDSSWWSQIWDYKRASNKACLLWKILYRANAMQGWHLFSDHSINARLQCILCVSPAIEDEAHLFWHCPYSTRLWQWLIHLFHLRASVPQYCSCCLR